MRWHSQIRMTVHPCARSWRATRRSRRWLRSIFLRHSRALVLGVTFFPQSCPCQKQPSTKTTTFSLRQTKSGFPGNGRCRRQPLSPDFRSRRTIVISVVSLPELRTRFMSWDRVKPPNVVLCSSAFPGQRPTMGLQTLAYLFPDNSREKRRHGIAYQVADFVHVRRPKPIDQRKRLECGRFAD